ADFAVVQGGPAGWYVIDQPLVAAAGQRREDMLRDRQRVAKEAAQEQGGARGAAVDTYLSLAAQHTDDPQNAHDSGVLACLRGVWARADDPRNAATRGQMRQALFDSLVDAWEEGIAGRKITCVNGRTTRILSALVLLDADERNWQVKKLEQFKNDIFEEAA